MTSPMRSFDPVRTGITECDIWVAYYRRQWGTFLTSAIGLIKYGFSLTWLQALQGAWLVLRANQLWAPLPDNDAHGARENMRRFYALVADVHRESFDVTEAARLEVEWWRVHRELQHERKGEGPQPLADAIAALYAHVYGIPVELVYPAAADRANAIQISDEWVAAGVDPASHLLVEERAALIRSYTALRDVVAPLRD